jgi:hypothetical protein
MKELRQFVEDRLTAMHARPAMWAGSKEAFVLQVVLLVEVMSPDNVQWKPSHLLAKFFPGPGPNRIPDEPVDDVWARRIVEIAREELP